MNKEKTNKKPITSQQVAVSRDSMRKIKIYAASNYMTISRTIDLAINNFCDGVSVEMSPGETANNNNVGADQ